MAELGYEGNSASEPIVPQPIRMIGLVLPPSDRDAYENNFFLKVIRGISQVCNQRQTASTIITGKDDEELLSSVKSLHHSGRIDGFILLYSRKSDRIIDYLCEQGILYVIVGKPSEFAGETLCIDTDNLQADREATDYLYNLGHRRIGYLGCSNDFLYTADRKAGYQLSMFLHQLPNREDHCIELNSKGMGNAALLRDLLSQPDRPTAFVVSDDMLALTLAQVCFQSGLSIPGDISIIAFNNSFYAQLSSPQLTTVDISSYQLGQQAAVQIISHAENPNLDATKIIVPHKIVERDSCRKITE